MKKLNTVVLAAFLLLFSTVAEAQVDLNQNAPIDPEIRMGKLDNGLSYFIRHNEEPEKRASFYIIQNVGAILENDDQNGLAHFLEHMSFNGTLHFPGKGIISSLEKHGVAFGYNINAYTSFDETVYYLSDVPVDHNGLIDTCLLILNDWSHYLSLESEEIDLERGVIAEEWRTSKTASRRQIFNVIREVLKGSMYEKRDIIGDIDIIKNFSHNTLRDFYHDWYRTDLQAIAVVGDIDVDDVEKKIIELFSQIPAVNDPKPRKFEVIPYHSDTRFILAQDKEASSTSVSVITLRDAVPKEEKDMNYIRNTYVRSLMNMMLSSRIAELLQKPNPPFISGSIDFGGYYPRNYDAFSISATARQNEEGLALQAIYSEAERVRQHGFTSAELSRAKANLFSSMENYYNQRNKIDNDTYISGIQSYFLNGEPLTSIEFDFEFLNLILDGISKEEIDELYRSVMLEDNRSIIIEGLEGEGIKHLTEEEALSIINSVKSTTLEAYMEEEINNSLIEEEIQGSPIVSSKPLPQFDAVEWTLGNNVKVVFKQAAYEKDNVSLQAFSQGGLSILDDDQVLAGNLVSAVSSMYGVGDYDNISLQKMLAGKNVSGNFSLDETLERITGSSSVKDLETMMQLLYLKFTRPRFDENSHNSYIARLVAQIEGMEKDPNKIMSDSLSFITNNYSPRTLYLTKESVEAVTVEDVKEVYNDRFKGAEEFTFVIVGNVTEEEVKPMVEKYIGSLPVSKREETFIDRKVGQPKGRVEKEIELALAIPKSTNYISFEKPMKYSPESYLGVAVLNGLLDIIYTEKVREEEGGTYGVSVSLSSRIRPSELVQGAISFDCDPEQANHLKEIIYDELNNLMKSGPSQTNLDKAVLNILKTREESKNHNSYWMRTLVNYYNLGIDFNDPRTYEDVLKSFTVKEIKKIAKQVFNKANVVDVTFMPAEE